jgi:hypothetical protein
MMPPLVPSTRPHLRIRRPSPTTAEFIVSSHPPLAGLRQHTQHAALVAGRLVLAVVCVLFLYLNLAPVDVSLSPSSSSSAAAAAGVVVAVGDGGIAAGRGGAQGLNGQPHHGRLHGDITSSRPAHHVFPGSGHQQQHHHQLHLHKHHHHHHPDDPFHPLALLRQAHEAIHALALSSAPTRHLARLAPTVSPWLAAAVAGAALWLASIRLRTTETLLVLRGLGVQVQGRFIPTENILDVLINEAFLGFEVRYYLAVIVEGEDDVVVVFPTLLPGRDVVEAVWRGLRGCLWEGDLVRRAGTK